jgi:hypothetical protein
LIFPSNKGYQDTLDSLNKDGDEGWEIAGVVNGYHMILKRPKATSTARAGDEPREPEKAPEGISSITKEHLNSKVPNFFYFDYLFDPQPGKRLWLRVDDEHFVERYPDGTESRFKVLGHAQARGMGGTVVVKIAGDPEKTGTDNEGGFQVFIPDKGNDEMAILMRDVNRGQPEPEWLDMSWSQNRKTIIQKVE